jgi:hypothetical protein
MDPIAAQFVAAYSQPRQTPGNEQSRLSNEQIDVVDEILSRFDSSDLGDQDIAEINSAFQRAGISASEDLRNAVADNGFNLDELARDNIVPPPPGPEIGRAPEPTEEFLETLDGILSTYNADQLSQEDIRNIRDELASSGFQAPGAQLVQVDA